MFTVWNLSESYGCVKIINSVENMPLLLMDAKIKLVKIDVILNHNNICFCILIPNLLSLSNKFYSTIQLLKKNYCCFLGQKLPVVILSCDGGVRDAQTSPSNVLSDNWKTDSKSNLEVFLF